MLGGNGEMVEWLVLAIAALGGAGMLGRWLVLRLRCREVETRLTCPKTGVRVRCTDRASRQRR